jgi:hypothetical protein
MLLLKNCDELFGQLLLNSVSLTFNRKRKQYNDITRKANFQSKCSSCAPPTCLHSLARLSKLFPVFCNISGVTSYKIPIEVHNLRVIDVELWCNDAGACDCVLKFFEQYFLIDSGCRPHY